MSRNTELEATVGDWLYVSCHCLVRLGNEGVVITYECDLCGNKNLRFIHTLEHCDGDGEPDGQIVQVGIECAALLMGDSDAHIPGNAENETKRKERWRIQYRKLGRCITTADDLYELGKL